MDRKLAAWVGGGAAVTVAIVALRLSTSAPPPSTELPQMRPPPIASRSRAGDLAGPALVRTGPARSLRTGGVAAERVGGPPPATAEGLAEALAGREEALAACGREARAAEPGLPASLPFDFVLSGDPAAGRVRVGQVTRARPDDGPAESGLDRCVAQALAGVEFSADQTVHLRADVPLGEGSP